LGTNRVEPCELTIDMAESHPDGFLLAGRYTLLDHKLALQRLMPACAAKKVDIVVGGPYSSGILAGGTHFEYQKASPEILGKVGRIKAIGERFGVPIKAAALQFSMAHPASAAVIPGATRPDHVKEDYAALAAVIPDDFWHEMRSQELVSAEAPLLHPFDPRPSAVYHGGNLAVYSRLPPGPTLNPARRSVPSGSPTRNQSNLTRSPHLGDVPIAGG